MQFGKVHRHCEQCIHKHFFCFKLLSSLVSKFCKNEGWWFTSCRIIPLMVSELALQHIPRWQTLILQFETILAVELCSINVLWFQNDGYESDMALAMNRYIGNSILPLLIKHSSFYTEADNYANLLDATLHTVYRLSKNRMLTKGQREAVSDFLVALTR